MRDLTKLNSRKQTESDDSFTYNTESNHDNNFHILIFHLSMNFCRQIQYFKEDISWLMNTYLLLTWDTFPQIALLEPSNWIIIFTQTRNPFTLGKKNPKKLFWIFKAHIWKLNCENTQVSEELSVSNIPKYGLKYLTVRGNNL